jgi:hypothetical protein
MYLSPSITAIGSPFLSSTNTGLGNVLFQIASCYGIAKQTARIAVWNKVVVFAHQLSERFGFHHKETIFRNFLDTADVAFRTIGEMDPWVHDSGLLRQLTESRDPVELRGYFECVPYFDSYKSELVSLLSPDVASLQTIRDKYPILFNPTYTTISVHFRGQEYVRGHPISRPWNYEYYRRAVEAFKHEPNPLFLIFSDDVESVDVSFLGDAPYRILTSHKEDYLDLWSMSLCTHNILSKSTFSFWAAYLNRNPTRRAVYNKDEAKAFHAGFTPL